PFARYWLHNGFITIDDEKMSKAAGNFFTVRDVAARFPYPVIRFFLLSAHYRMPINYSAEMLSAAQSGLQRILNCVENLDFAATARRGEPAAADREADTALDACRSTCRERFVEALEDDLNTADALAAVFELVRAANTALADAPVGVPALEAAAGTIRELCGVLGIGLDAEGGDVPAEILRLVEERAAAKKSRDFARADELRERVRALGFTIEDTPQGAKVGRV
ncbi:MAG: class I tRNA ligase family protein, partial [Clostridia bacterium]|nr:class I tRNA ligase family protein [Clostridia bacterium]